MQSSRPLNTLYMHMQSGDSDGLSRGIANGVYSVAHANDRAIKMATGGVTHVSGPMTSSPTPPSRSGVPSTGNPVADARIAAGDQRVLNNLRESAILASHDHERNGTPIPMGLKGFVPAMGGDNAGGRGLGFLGGYTGLWDMINGGGPGASRYGNTAPADGSAPANHPRGIAAILNDLGTGGIQALYEDATNGGGLGASGDHFEGGIRSMVLNTLGVPPRGQPGSPFGGLSSVPGTEATPATGMAAGGITSLAPPSGGNEKDLVSTAIAAIKGQLPDPRPALGAFLAKYGEAALRDLVNKVESGAVDDTARRSEGMINGPGDGMDDRVPAKVHNGHDVLLANNEYIVPADVVSALGNGSSDAGAAKMDAMLDRVRTSAHGTTKQQRPVNADKILPA